MSTLIDGLDMPVGENGMLCIDIYPDGKVTIDGDLKCRRIATAMPGDRPTGHWRECGDNQPMSKDTVYCCPMCGKRRLFEWQLINYCPDCGLRLFKPVPQTKDGGQDE